MRPAADSSLKSTVCSAVDRPQKDDSDFDFSDLMSGSVSLVVLAVATAQGRTHMSAPPLTDPRPEVKVFGVDLTVYPHHVQFGILGGCALLAALTFAFLQEKV